MAIYAMMELINQLALRNTDTALEERILEEALWGLDYLMKIRFDGGYRITWSKMRMYTDCIIGTTDDVITPAQNIPWQNFLGAGIEALVYNVLKDRKPELARKCLQFAEEDWEAATRLQEKWLVSDSKEMGWSSGGTYLTASWGVISSLNLYRATRKKVYADHAIEYGRLLMRCQEWEFLDGIPITGFFYTSPEKVSILHHLHNAFEESPLLALTGLCTTFPDHEDWIEWYGAVILHSEYFLKRGAQYSMPYCMLPNSVFRKSEILSVTDPEMREGMLKQFLEGTRFTDEYYLRCFPIWTGQGYHGNTNVQLSETMALTLAVHLRNDIVGENLVCKQLQWVFGGNPFSQSLMYGEGYDYAPLYAPNPGDIVGALPVGMDCMNNDEPYWYDSNTWTFKEIWVNPVLRFIWNAAYVGMQGFVQGKIEGEDVNTISFSEQRTSRKKSVLINSDRTFRTILPAGEYLIECGTALRLLTVVSGGNYNITLNPGRNIEFTASVKNKSTRGRTLRIEVTAEGNGIHNLAIRAFNVAVTDSEKTVDLGEGKKVTIHWDIQIKEADIPWVVVIIPDGDLTLKKELTGTLEEK